MNTTTSPNPLNKVKVGSFRETNKESENNTLSQAEAPVGAQPASIDTTETILTTQNQISATQTERPDLSEKKNEEQLARAIQDETQKRATREDDIMPLNLKDASALSASDLVKRLLQARNDHQEESSDTTYASEPDNQKH